jgi:hypothetical protein
MCRLWFQRQLQCRGDEHDSVNAEAWHVGMETSCSLLSRIG